MRKGAERSDRSRGTDGWRFARSYAPSHEVEVEIVYLTRSGMEIA
jgi:hypothetical protein